MSNLKPQRGVKIQNDSGMIIPPYSIVVVTSVEYIEQDADNGIDADTIHHVTQYSGQQGNILVTGNSQINLDYGGYAYADQLIYVAVDPAVTMATGSVGSTSNSGLTAGTVLGPVSGKWWIGLSGSGFSAQGTSVKVISPDTNGSYADSAVICYRGNSSQRFYLGMIRSTVTAGTLANPTALKFDAWPPIPGTSGPARYAVATNPSLIGMDVYNVECFSVSASTSGSGSASAGISIPGRIDYDEMAGQWILTAIFRCKQVATTVSCVSGTLSVVYDNVPG